MTRSTSIRPDTKVLDLAFNEVLENLSRNGILVYLRIVAASAVHGRRLNVTSLGLMPKAGRSASNLVFRALDQLVEAKLIKVTYKFGPHGGVLDRTVDLLG